MRGAEALYFWPRCRCRRLDQHRPNDCEEPALTKLYRRTLSSPPNIEAVRDRQPVVVGWAERAVDLGLIPFGRFLVGRVHNGYLKLSFSVHAANTGQGDRVADWVSAARSRIRWLLGTRR
jgi:hypothetical protein